MNKLESFFKNHSATVLTVIGAIGTVATAVIAVKETPKALAALQLYEEDKGTKLTKKEIVKCVYPYYIPAALTCAGTWCCIFGANVLNKKQQASLTSAYLTLDQTYRAYKNKVDEVCGEGSDNKIVKAIAIDNQSDIKLSNDEELFFDAYSLRYFVSTMKQVTDAEKNVIDIYKKGGAPRLSDFYEFLNLDPYTNDYYEGCGYIFDDTFSPIEDMRFTYEKSVTEDGREFWIINMDFN